MLFSPIMILRKPNHKQFLNLVTYWDQSAKIQGVKNSSQDACDAPFPSAFSLWNRNHSRHILSASYWWSTAKLFWLLIYMGQPTGSCCLLKSEYLRQFITVALSKITKTVYTIKKKQQVTAARESQLLKKCISKNAHSRITMKTGHEKKKKRKRSIRTSFFLHQAVHITWARYDWSVLLSLPHSPSVWASCFPEAADYSPSVQAGISGKKMPS